MDSIPKCDITVTRLPDTIEDFESFTGKPPTYYNYPLPHSPSPATVRNYKCEAVYNDIKSSSFVATFNLSVLSHGKLGDRAAKQLFGSAQRFPDYKPKENRQALVNELPEILPRMSRSVLEFVSPRIAKEFPQASNKMRTNITIISPVPIN